MPMTAGACSTHPEPVALLVIVESNTYLSTNQEDSSQILIAVISLPNTGACLPHQEAFS